MSWIIAGLGNPGEEYECTRHNVGRMALEAFVDRAGFAPWKKDAAKKRLISQGLVGKTVVVAVLPETFMNRSGAAISSYIKTQKAAERLIVVYDDLDMPLGSIKVSFDRGAGGHKGLDSIVRAVKTTKFARVRIGISPVDGTGGIKKPKGEKEVEKFVLGIFTQSESAHLKPVLARAAAAIEAIIARGVDRAMNEFN